MSAVPSPREPECCRYPVSWLGLKDPKSLYHGCPAKGLCELRAGAGPQLGSLTPFPVGQKPFCCCSSHKAVPDPELMPMGTLGELDRVPLRIHVCMDDYFSLAKTNPALIMGFYLTLCSKNMCS